MSAVFDLSPGERVRRMPLASALPPGDRTLPRGGVFAGVKRAAWAGACHDPLHSRPSHLNNVPSQRKPYSVVRKRKNG
jgi:hypothetical protein